MCCSPTVYPCAPLSHSPMSAKTCSIAVPPHTCDCKEITSNLLQTTTVCLSIQGHCPRKQDPGYSMSVRGPCKRHSRPVNLGPFDNMEAAPSLPPRKHGPFNFDLTAGHCPFNVPAQWPYRMCDPAIGFDAAGFSLWRFNPCQAPQHGLCQTPNHLNHVKLGTKPPWTTPPAHETKQPKACAMFSSGGMSFQHSGS